MSSIGGYRSPVDLGLGQVPLTEDPLIFNEMTEVYNAIHLLNAYLDQLRVIAEGGGGSGQSPADSMPFNRFFVAPALVAISAGDIVCPSSIPGQNGIILGALANDPTLANCTANFCGVALIDAGVGDDVRVGVGPASLEVPGAVTSSLLWAYGSRNSIGVAAGDGILYTSNPGVITVAGGLLYPMPVGTCPVNGFGLIGQYIAR
ncbi:hypothetical protein D3C87_600910 [compost metagenome]